MKLFYTLAAAALLSLAAANEGSVGVEKQRGEKQKGGKGRRRRRGRRGRKGDSPRPPPMNNLPGQFRVSNAPDFEAVHRGEYFEVLTDPIRYQYSEVSWRPTEPIPIPVNTTQMHILGMELNFVRLKDDGTFEEVPSIEAYNHHVTLQFLGLKTDGSIPKMVQVPKGKKHKKKGMHSLYHVEETHDPETGEVVAINEFLGAEIRGSFFYTPVGYAKNIHRPVFITLEPMLINTHNPNVDERCSVESENCPMPASALRAMAAESNVSPLLECPCTDRIVKEIDQYYITGGLKCDEGYEIATLTECVAAAREVGIRRPAHTEVVNTNAYPPGCLIFATSEGGKVYFNSRMNSPKTCPQNVETEFTLADVAFLDDAQAQVAIYGSDTFVNMTGPADDGTEIFVNMTGPAEFWFGFGFPANSGVGGSIPNLQEKVFSMGKMDGALVWIAQTDGQVVHRRLGDHNPGEDLNLDRTTVISNTVKDGRRTVSLKWDPSPKLGESSKDHWDSVGKLAQTLLDASAARAERIAVIMAVGRTSNFQFHGPQRGSIRTFSMPHDVEQCVCRNDEEFPVGTINGVLYSPDCAPQLIEEKNPICDVRSYPGGQLCCPDGTILLDRDQKPPANTEDEVYIKIRVYYEDGEKITEQPKNVMSGYYSPEGDQGEYHIPVTESGRHVLERNVTAAIFGTQEGHPWEVVWAAGHCHTPECISQELWLRDPDRLLCSTTMNYGNGTWWEGKEEGYMLGSSVCLWGDDDGLEKPPVFTHDTKIMFRKVANATFPHYGDMAGWLINYYIQ